MQKQNEGVGRYPHEMSSRSRTLECPLLVMADSYKAGHFKMYQNADVMSAYGEFREPMKLNGIDDPRIVVYGMRHIIDQLISRIITKQDFEWAKKFYSTHGIGNTAYDFPEAEFEKISKLGHFPVKIDALPEGSVVLPHTPIFFITATNEYSRFCTFLETILTMIWYPSCVATLSKHTKCLIEAAFENSVEDGVNNIKLMSRLHDFGFRGCTCVEQSVIGGSAHLLNFDGSDTMSASFHVQYHLNNGNPIGQSIPATEHSVMTSYEYEIAAMNNLIDKFPGKMVACVMDSYNYDHALETFLPLIQKKLSELGAGTFVIRPDSGDPVIQVLKGLRAALAAEFPNKTITVNGNNFIVFSNVSVIQGDGIDYNTVKEILDAVQAAGFSAENVAFGMGGGLLQKVNRDTLGFATKLSYVKLSGGDAMDIMKAPQGVPEKHSLPGIMQVMNNKSTRTHHTVFPIEGVEKAKKEGYVNSMVTVYDNGVCNEAYLTEAFYSIRTRVNSEWISCKETFFVSDKWGSPLHISMQEKRKTTAETITTGKHGSYPSNASLFADTKFNLINQIIKDRNDSITKRKNIIEDGLELFEKGTVRGIEYTPKQDTIPSLRTTEEIFREYERESKKMFADLKHLARELDGGDN